MTRHYVLNADLNLRCGQPNGYATFAEAVQVMSRCKAEHPTIPFRIKSCEPSFARPAHFINAKA